MKVAVIGAGYVGLATAWHFLQRKVAVTVFDAGPGASHASTGLLHPYPGKKGLMSWRAEEGMSESITLLQQASEDGSVFEQSGILRTFENGETKLIKEGIVVYSRPYLKALKDLCKDAEFQCKKIQNVQELDSFDCVILAAGAGILEFEECKNLPLKRTIGQSLLCRGLKKLPIPLLFPGGHITPTEDPGLYQVGSTYEHTTSPDQEKARALLDNAIVYCPEARHFEILEIRSGVRISPKVGYQPIVEKLQSNVFIMTGFGSRGLLYHAMMSKMLVSSVLNTV